MKRLIVLVLLAAIQLSQAEESTNKLVYNAVKSNPIPAKPLQGYQSITQTLAAAKDTFALGFFTVPNCRVNDRLKCPENDPLVCPIYPTWVLLCGDHTKGGLHVKQKGPFYDKTITPTGRIYR